MWFLTLSQWKCHCSVQRVLAFLMLQLEKKITDWIVKLLRLEKTSEIIKPNHQPNPTMPSNSAPKYHMHPFHLQGGFISTTSLGSQCQCLPTPCETKSFLISTLTLPHKHPHSELIAVLHYAAPCSLIFHLSHPLCFRGRPTLVLTLPPFPSGLITLLYLDQSMGGFWYLYFPNRDLSESSGLHYLFLGLLHFAHSRVIISSLTKKEKIQLKDFTTLPLKL